MTASKIANIYNDFRKAIEYPPEYTIDFFKKNGSEFDNIRTFEDESDLSLYIQLLWQQLNALYQKDRHKETVDIATKYLEIIDRKSQDFNIKKVKDDWYYGILFFKGMALYKLGECKNSTPIFEQLVAHDSKNGNFKNWLRYSLYRQRKWVSNFIVVLCGLLLFLEIFFNKYIPSFYVRISLDIIAFIGIIGTIIYDYYIKQSFKNWKL